MKRRHTVEDLRREEELILLWIRDITAAKRARLREIRCKLNGFLPLEIRRNPKRGFAAKG
jgi:hypothetical protein